MSYFKFNSRKFFIKDLVVASLITCLPFAFFLYEFVPDIKVWETYFFTINSNYYESVQVLAWTLSNKLLVFVALIIWFVTCKHWWRYTILIPIIIELFKILRTINADVSFSDEFEFIESLPFTIPIMILLFLLSRKLNFYSRSRELRNEINDEINFLINELSSFRTMDYKKLSNDLAELKNNKDTYDKDEYLKKLIILRDRFSTLD